LVDAVSKGARCGAGGHFDPSFVGADFVDQAGFDAEFSAPSGRCGANVSRSMLEQTSIITSFSAELHGRSVSASMELAE
jgi:hypothetical protein